MSQINVNARERATFIGEETSFGVLPSGSFPNAMTRCFPLGDDLIVGDLATEMLPVMNEKVRRFDAQQPVHGLKIASKVGGLKTLLKATPSASQLSAAGAAGSLSPRLLLRHCFAEYAVVGSVSASSASATAVTVTTGEGVNFRKGTFIAVENAANEMEWTKITNISTDTLTVSPALTGIPADGAIVRNLYDYAPSESLQRSLSIQQRFVGESDQSTSHSIKGCFGDLSWDLPVGKLPSMTLGVTATDYAFGETVSIATASDDMGASFKWAPSVYLTTTAISRIAPIPCEGVTLAFADAVEMVRDPSATQTVSSIVRVGGNPSVVKLGVKLRFDADHDTAFAADTAYTFVVVQKIGTGTTASFWIMEVPVAKLVGQPKRIKIGERLHLDLAFEGYQDSSVTLASETGEELDFIKSPLRIAFG